jgi:hypothetical protein
MRARTAVGQPRKIHDCGVDRDSPAFDRDYRTLIAMTDIFRHPGEGRDPLCSRSPDEREDRTRRSKWIPAFAGMTMVE